MPRPPAAATGPARRFVDVLIREGSARPEPARPSRRGCRRRQRFPCRHDYYSILWRRFPAIRCVAVVQILWSVPVPGRYWMCPTLSEVDRSADFYLSGSQQVGSRFVRKCPRLCRGCQEMAIGRSFDSIPFARSISKYGQGHPWPFFFLYQYVIFSMRPPWFV